MRFHDLWVIPVFLPPLLFLVWKWRERALLRYSDTRLVKPWDARRIRSLVLRGGTSCVVLLMLIAFARPYVAGGYSYVVTNTRDTVIILDKSASMDKPYATTSDYSERRSSSNTEGKKKYDIARELTTKFILLRKGDQLTVFVFNDEIYAIVPLTDDHAPILDWLRLPDTARLGTAVSTALLAALSHLKERAKTGERAVIMIGDGEGLWDAGEVVKIRALIQELDAKIYWVYVENITMMEWRMRHNIWDESQLGLGEFVRGSGGKMFPVNSEAAFDEAFAAIAELQTKPVFTRVKLGAFDVYHWFILAALLCSCLGYFGARFLLH